MYVHNNVYICIYIERERYLILYYNTLVDHMLYEAGRSPFRRGSRSAAWCRRDDIYELYYDHGPPEYRRSCDYSEQVTIIAYYNIIAYCSYIIAYNSLL